MPESFNSLNDLSEKIDLNKLSDNGSDRSMFNKNAIIDYARIMTDGQFPENKDKYESKVSTGYVNNDGVFSPNNNTNINMPVSYSDDLDELDIPNIVAWSGNKNYKHLELKYQDFVYCKRLGYYPNNRLIILRRFLGGVPDNIFDYGFGDNSPVSTLVTWLDPKDDNFISFDFNEVWKPYDTGILNLFDSTKKDNSVGSSVSSNPITSASIDAVAAMIGDQLQADLQRVDGTKYSEQSMDGNPNLITAAHKRETGGNGLESDINFNLTFEYDLRFMPDIDPSIAFMDMVCNCIRMGTSTESFKFNVPALMGDETVQYMMQNNMDKAYTVFSEKIKNLNDSMMSGFKKLVNYFDDLSVTKTDVSDAVSNAAIFMVSRYRESLKAAISVDTGLPSGIWHVTIGNPKAPTVSCGDLVIHSSSLVLGNELGYNDFPNSFKVTYKLKSARERGSQELQRIFNAGRGRYYVYPNTTDNPDYFHFSGNESDNPLQNNNN